MNDKILLAPSILSADFSRLGEDVAAVEAGGADAVHVDVMDGMFVPNITFGPGVTAAVKRSTSLPLDVHLMIADPGRYVEEFVRAGAHWLTVHAEACPHLHRVLQQIRGAGAKCGAALNPATPLSALDEAWPFLDMVLVMTVNPGYGGQSFIPTMPDKIRRARERIDREGRGIVLAVDGGVNADTIGTVTEAGADLLVMGSYVYGAPSVADRLKEARALCSTR